MTVVAVAVRVGGRVEVGSWVAMPVGDAVGRGVTVAPAVGTAVMGAGMVAVAVAAGNASAVAVDDNCTPATVGFLVTVGDGVAGGVTVHVGNGVAVGQGVGVADGMLVASKMAVSAVGVGVAVGGSLWFGWDAARCATVAIGSLGAPVTGSMFVDVATPGASGRACGAGTLPTPRWVSGFSATAMAVLVGARTGWVWPRASGAVYVYPLSWSNPGAGRRPAGLAPVPNAIVMAGVAVPGVGWGLGAVDASRST